MQLKNNIKCWAIDDQPIYKLYTNRRIEQLQKFSNERKMKLKIV